MQDAPFTGTLMSGDVAVAEIKADRLTPTRKELMPLYLQLGGDFRHWLSTRAIDKHRTNSRLLKKALRLTEYSDESIVLTVNAATITDNFWVKPQGQALCYAEVRFTQNLFDRVAFLGSPHTVVEAMELVHTEGVGSKAVRTPELTNIGSYEKCWRLEGGEWWMHKRADTGEAFSELFVYELGKALGFSMAEYRRTEKGVASRDFTNAAAVNFEPAHALMGQNEDYIDNYKALGQMGHSFTDAYLEMVFLDVVCMNVDRHTANYGFLRDAQTGELLSLAPNFDNNISLISQAYPPSPERKGDRMLQDLRALETQCGAISDYATRHPLPVVTDEMVNECIDRTGMRKEIDAAFVLQYVTSSYRVSVVGEMHNARQQQQAQQLL